MRWATEGHDDSKTIMNKELEILNKLKSYKLYEVINFYFKLLTDVRTDQQLAHFRIYAKGEFA